MAGDRDAFAQPAVGVAHRVGGPAAGPRPWLHVSVLPTAAVPLIAGAVRLVGQIAATTTTTDVTGRRGRFGGALCWSPARCRSGGPPSAEVTV